jgi:hypothetical protein
MYAFTDMVRKKTPKEAKLTGKKTLRRTNLFVGFACGIFIVGLSVFMARDLLAKAFLQCTLSKALKLPVEIGRVDLGIRAPRIRIHDLRVLNPRGFDQTVFLSVPWVVADYSPRDVCIRKKFGLLSLRLFVSNVNVVKNQAGDVNLSVMEGRGKGRLPAGRVELAIGRATYLDLTLSPGQDTKSYEIGLDQVVLENTSGLTDLLNAIILKTLEKVSFKEFGVNLRELTEELSENLKGTQ